MRPTSQKWVMGGFIGLALAAQGWAVDRYVIEAPTSLTIGDSGALIKVTPMAGGAVDSTAHEVEFTNLPVGVSILPVDPATDLGVSGPTSFKIFVSSNVRPGPLSPVCQKKEVPSVQGSAVILLEKPVSRFVLFPLPRSVEKPGLTQLQIVALDDRGIVVPSYRGDLFLRSSAGQLESDQVLGNEFDKGVAVVPLLFRGAIPVGVVRVSVEEQVPGPGRTTSAQGETSVKSKAVTQ